MGLGGIVAADGYADLIYGDDHFFFICSQPRTPLSPAAAAAAAAPTSEPHCTGHLGAVMLGIAASCEGSSRVLQGPFAIYAAVQSRMG